MISCRSAHFAHPCLFLLHFHPHLPHPMLHCSVSHHCLPVLVSFIWWPCASPWPHLWSRSIEAERGWASTVWWFPLSLGLVNVCHEDAFHHLGVIIFHELIRLPYLAICWTWDEHFILLKIGGNNPLQYSLSSTFYHTYTVDKHVPVITHAVSHPELIFFLLYWEFTRSAVNLNFKFNF